MGGADEWSPQARLGFGLGIFVGFLLLAGLIPQARRFVAYEFETQPKRLFVARISALIGFAVSFGAWVNDVIEAGSKSYDCVDKGCGSGWDNESASRYVMMKGAINTLSVILVQQIIFWVPAGLRGLTTFTILLVLTANHIIAFYVPFSVDAGPYGWDTELYRVCQFMPMVVAVVLLWPYYTYNDTIYNFRGAQDADDVISGIGVPDSLRTSYRMYEDPDENQNTNSY